MPVSGEDIWCSREKAINRIWKNEVLDHCVSIGPSLVKSDAGRHPPSDASRRTRPQPRRASARFLIGTGFARRMRSNRSMLPCISSTRFPKKRQGLPIIGFPRDSIRLKRLIIPTRSFKPRSTRSTLAISRRFASTMTNGRSAASGWLVWERGIPDEHYPTSPPAVCRRQGRSALRSRAPHEHCRQERC